MQDLNEVLRLHNDAHVQKYLGEEYPKDEAFIENIIQNIWMKEYRELGHGRWATIEKSSGLFMGWAGLKYIEEYDFVDLGYRFFPEFWGKGYGTEVSFALRDYAFETLKMRELWGMAWFQNEASKKILKRIGLNFVKREPWDEMSKDVMWYRMTMEEYQKLQK